MFNLYDSTSIPLLQVLQVLQYIFHINSKHHEQISTIAKLSQTNVYRDRFRRVPPHDRRHFPDGRKGEKKKKRFHPRGLTIDLDPHGPRRE